MLDGWMDFTGINVDSMMKFFRVGLTSTENFKCTVISTSFNLGDRTFAAVGPRLWSRLPTHVHWLYLSYTSYWKLRTFNCLRHQWLVNVAFSLLGAVYKFTYCTTLFLFNSSCFFTTSFLCDFQNSLPFSCQLTQVVLEKAVKVILNKCCSSLVE